MLKGSLIKANGIWHWRFKYTDLNGTIQKTQRSTELPIEGTTKLQAIEKGQEKQAEFLKGYYKEVSAECWTFVEYAEAWIDSKVKEVREITLDGYRSYLKHIKAFFGDMWLSDITRRDIEAYYQHLLSVGLSENSLPKHRVIINGALREAYYKKLLPENLTEGIRLPRTKRFEGKAYSLEDAQRLLAAVKNEPLYIAVVLAVVYGLRRSEVCGLRWCDVDLDGGVMHIRNTVVKVKSSIELETTKSRASKRTISLSADTVSYLRNLKVEQAAYREQHGTAADPAWHICQHKKTGKPFAPDYVTKTFKRVLVKNELPIIRFHDLRHTAGSLLLEVAELPIKHIQELLGHEKASTTLDTYCHLSRTAKKETAAAMAGLLKVG